LKNFKLIIFVLLILLTCFFAAKVIATNADELVIHDNGEVVLMITNDNSVLAATTTKEPEKTPPPKTSTKTVSLTPAHSESTVKITPPVNNDKKIQVTITTKSTPPVDTKTPPASTSVTSTTPSKTDKPSDVQTKTVDQVVEQGSNGKPVISITSQKANELTISQGNTQVSTLLPLQINTVSHAISVTSSPAETSRVSVLPTEAIQGILNSGVINSSNIDSAKISLSQDQAGVNYTAKGEQKGKLLGLINVSSPVEVKLSAQNGKVVKTSQSPLFQYLGAWIR